MWCVLARVAGRHASWLSPSWCRDGWRERVEQVAPCSATRSSSPFVALIVITFWSNVPASVTMSG